MAGVGVFYGSQPGCSSSSHACAACRSRRPRSARSERPAAAAAVAAAAAQVLFADKGLKEPPNLRFLALFVLPVEV